MKNNIFDTIKEILLIAWLIGTIVVSVNFILNGDKMTVFGGVCMLFVLILAIRKTV